MGTVLFSEEKIKEIVQMFGKVPVKDIAKQFGVVPNNIHSLASRLGLSCAITPISKWKTTEAKFLREWAGIISASEIAKRLNKTRKQVYAYANRHGIILTLKEYDSEDIRLTSIMRRDGFSVLEIAEKLELGVKQINMIIKFEL